jgi:phosphoglucomutase
MSPEFARETASIMAGNGIPVRFFEDITPTPLCSFAVRETGATAGIVVTASHNPPEYNGYKVYWSDGGQIVPPHDKNIIAQVEKIESVSSIKKMGFAEGVSSGIITILKDDFHDIYIRALEKESLREKGPSPVKIVYSALHGSGYRIVPKTLRHFGFNDIHMESEQSIPDGNFPTVESPNPEEPGAMKRAMELAEKVQADIVMATDPDSDRMGIAFRNREGEYILINGNQIGVMLEYYILTRRAENKSLPSGGVIVKTIVTSEIQREVAEHFGCRAEDVLTGFKWIAALMKKYEETGDATFIFGGEESYGYLGVPFVRDKDAVSSCLFFAEMTDWLKSSGRTPMDFLNEIYLKFHCYLEDMHSLTMKGKDGLEKIKNLMKRFRVQPPKSISNIAVHETRDYLAGGKAASTGLPSSDVLQFILADGSLITMRPSGTEPKIKFYFSVREKAEAHNLEEVQAGLRKRIDAIKEDLLRQVDNFIPAEI